MYCPPLSELPRGTAEIGHWVPESRWSRVMEFHLLVMSMYRMSTAAMDRLLLLSLQFLPKTGRDTSPQHQTGPCPSRLHACAWAALPARQAPFPVLELMKEHGRERWERRLEVYCDLRLGHVGSCSWANGLQRARTLGGQVLSQTWLLH